MPRQFLIGVALMAITGYFGLLGNPRPPTISNTRVIERDPAANADAPRNVKENVVAYRVGDLSIAAARQKARETLPRFFAMHKEGVNGAFTLKFPLTQNGKTEHIWMEFVQAKGDRIIGLLSNEPVEGDKYKMGDRMDVAKSDIEDWMVRTQDGFFGGYADIQCGPC